MRDGSVGQGSRAERTVERVRFDRPPSAEIIRKDALDKSACGGDVYRVTGKVMGKADGERSALTRSADSRAVVICGRKEFSQDGLHVDGVFDRA